MKHFVYLFIFLLSFQAVSAQVIFNEMQTSPIGERFIELYNTGNSDIDLTGWYIQRKTATGSKFGSLVTKTDFENKIIKADEYFLISRSSIPSANIVIENLTLTQSNALRLRNSGGEDIDQIKWENLSEGKSYQKTGSGWIEETPTPGFSNNLEASLPNSNPTQDDQSNGGVRQKPLPLPIATGGGSWPVKPQIFARIKNVPRVAVVGAGILLEGEALGLKKEPLEGARYLWTFGDGGTKEGESVLYNYNYPGKYVVVLNASSGKYSASDRMKIKVIPADITIYSVGTSTDSFIEVQNNTKYELDLTWWRLRLSAQAGTGEQFFTIPKDTIILPNNKTIFPPQWTEFNIKNGDGVELLYPNGNIATSYSWISNIKSISATQQITQVAQTSALIIPSVKIPIINTKKTIDKSSFTIDSSVKVLKKEESSVEIIGENQSANIFIGTSKNDNGIYKWLFGVTSLAIISILGVLFTRKREIEICKVDTEVEKYEIIKDKD